MDLRGTAGTVLLLALLGGAQQSRPRPAGRGAEAASAAAGPPALVQELYRQARQALPFTAPLAAPELLSDIARDEQRWFPDQARQDFADAFTLARALPLPSPPDPSVPSPPDFKQQTELNAIAAIARGGDLDQALTLTRLADVPKGPLYDQLILLVDARRAPSQPPDPTTRQNAAATIFDLVEECQLAGGAFPYRGISGVIRRRQLDPLDLDTLARDGYARAGNETDPAQMIAALTFLQAAHPNLPELDSQLESTLGAMLQNLNQANFSALSGSANGLAPRLMALLAQVDPQRALALAAQLPSLDSSPPPVASGLGLNPGSNSLVFNFSATATAPAPADSGEASGATQFLALVSQSEGQIRRQPQDALALANQAADLLDDSLWATQTEAAARLAAVYHQLGASADSSRLLARALDEADQQARAADTNDLADAPSLQAQTALGFESASRSVLDVYSLAARLDLATTAQHAETASFVLLKPLILARIALVAQLAQRTLPRR